MSIVEKALTKLQGTTRQSGDNRSAVVHPIATALPVHDVAGAPIAQEAAAELAVAANISVDPKSLQAAGMLPPESGALLVRNQFRRLKWSLLDEIEQRRRQRAPLAGSVMVTSALPGEGKTFTCVNLAISVAREENHRVVLVDSDVAKGHISALFGLQDRPGLMDLLTNTSLRIADVLVRTDLGNLYVLPAGKFRPHVAELLASARMLQLVAELSGDTRGRIALFDSSPVLATNAAQVLGRVLSQVMFIVRAQNTTQAAVLAALELLDRNKVAAVLNQSQVSLGAENYNHNYGYYGNEER